MYKILRQDVLDQLQVAAYVSVQVLASILASGTVEIIFGTEQHHFLGTLPSGSNIQSLVLEFIITFYLMFAVSGVATDDQAVSYILLNLDNQLLEIHNRTLTKLKVFNIFL